MCTLFGTKFKVVTDHSALTWLMSITEPTGRLARWAIYLQSYTFDIEHRKGIKHQNVDVLSRPVLLAVQHSASKEETEPDLYENDPFMNYVRLKHTSWKVQVDNNASELNDKPSHFQLD